jgi:hypothetical protein
MSVAGGVLEEVKLNGNLWRFTAGASAGVTASQPPAAELDRSAVEVSAWNSCSRLC